MGIKHIHGSTTSLNGCKVDIDGDVEYSYHYGLPVFMGRYILTVRKVVPMEICISELNRMANRF